LIRVRLPDILSILEQDADYNLSISTPFPCIVFVSVQDIQGTVGSFSYFARNGLAWCNLRFGLLAAENTWTQGKKVIGD
jgi:hypothetical protein